MSDAPSPAGPTAGPAVGGRPRRRAARLLLVGALGAAAVGGALAGAAALDRPVGAGARDVLPAMPDQAARPPAGAEFGLPPLAMVLEAPPPDGIEELPPPERINPLLRLTGVDAPARRYVELGWALQSIGEGSEAALAFREGLRRERNDLGAQIGLIMVPAAGGDPAAMAEADARLAALEAEHPESQLVGFNRAWLAVYRADVPVLRAALERTIALDPDTPLGRSAARLLAELERGGAPGPPETP